MDIKQLNEELGKILNESDYDSQYDKSVWQNEEPFTVYYISYRDYDRKLHTKEFTDKDRALNYFKRIENDNNKFDKRCYAIDKEFNQTVGWINKYFYDIDGEKREPLEYMQLKGWANPKDTKSTYRYS